MYTSETFIRHIGNGLSNEAMTEKVDMEKFGRPTNNDLSLVTKPLVQYLDMAEERVKQEQKLMDQIKQEEIEGSLGHTEEDVQIDYDEGKAEAFDDEDSADVSELHPADKSDKAEVRTDEQHIPDVPVEERLSEEALDKLLAESGPVIMAGKSWIDGYDRKRMQTEHWVSRMDAMIVEAGGDANITDRRAMPDYAMYRRPDKWERDDWELKLEE